MPLDINQLKHLDQCAKSRQFTAEDYQLLKTLFSTHRELVNLLKDPDTSLDDVYEFLSSDEDDTRASDPASDPASDGIESPPEGRGE